MSTNLYEYVQIAKWIVLVCVFFKQKAAYEVRISDWSSDVCSSDLPNGAVIGAARQAMLQAVEEELATARQVAQKIEGRIDDLMASIDDIQLGRASCRESVCQYV